MDHSWTHILNTKAGEKSKLENSQTSMDSSLTAELDATASENFYHASTADYNKFLPHGKPAL